MSKNKPFFGRKICIACKEFATVFTATESGNKVFCDKCKKKLFIEQPFNGIKFKSLDIIAKEQSQINSEKDI